MTSVTQTRVCTETATHWTIISTNVAVTTAGPANTATRVRAHNYMFKHSQARVNTVMYIALCKIT